MTSVCIIVVKVAAHKHVTGAVEFDNVNSNIDGNGSKAIRAMAMPKIRKNAFSQRMISEWNRLLSECVPEQEW